MATDHTTRHNLNQWIAADPVLREDFNADNAKIEAALIELRNTVLSAEITMMLFEGLEEDIAALEARVEQLEAK